MYAVIARVLQFFYQLWPNYAGAISLLTLAIMVVLMPLTLKGTRSMLAMQKLQPEMKKLQEKHRDDRQRLNEELMKFYKENNISPVSGCLPLLLQMPVFWFLYRTLYQLLTRARYGQDMGAAVARASSHAGTKAGVFERFGWFQPKHLDKTSKLYHDLSHTGQMKSFGLNLADSATKAVGHGFTKALPFIILVLGVTASTYFQQKQIAGRNPEAAAANPQAQMMMKVMPLAFAVISLTIPAGIVVYFLVSNVFRIGQQALITRTMYGDEDSVVATTGRATDTSSTSSKGKPAAAPAQLGFRARLRELQESGATPQIGKNANRGGGSSGSGGSGGAKGGGTKPSGGSAKAGGGSSAASGSKSSNGSGRSSSSTSGTAPRPSRSAPQSANRSRNKKKRK